MEVQVIHRLARLRPAVIHHAKISIAAELIRNLCNHRKDVAHNGAVCVVNFVRAGDVFLWNHKEMYRRLWVDIVESVAQIILIDLLARNFSGNDFAKQAVHL